MTEKIGLAVINSPNCDPAPQMTATSSPSTHNWSHVRLDHSYAAVDRQNIVYGFICDSLVKARVHGWIIEETIAGSQWTPRLQGFGGEHPGDGLRAQVIPTPFQLTGSNSWRVGLYGWDPTLLQGPSSSQEVVSNANFGGGWQVNIPRNLTPTASPIPVISLWMCAMPPQLPVWPSA